MASGSGWAIGGYCTARTGSGWPGSGQRSAGSGSSFRGGVARRSGNWRNGASGSGRRFTGVTIAITILVRNPEAVHDGCRMSTATLVDSGTSSSLLMPLAQALTPIGSAHVASRLSRSPVYRAAKETELPPRRPAKYVACRSPSPILQIGNPHAGNSPGRRYPAPRPVLPRLGHRPVFRPLRNFIHASQRLPSTSARTRPR